MSVNFLTAQNICQGPRQFFWQLRFQCLCVVFKLKICNRKMFNCLLDNDNVSALFLEQYILKYSKATYSTECREACWKIAPGSEYFMDYFDTWDCRCNFCFKHLTNLLVSPQRMAYFLEYTGCEDIFSLKISHQGRGAVYC